MSLFQLRGKSKDRYSAPHDQSADFVELFFDLIFVFAITQVTHFTSKHLDLQGVGQSLLIFWLVWWAWTQFTWSLNSADTSLRDVRVGTLISTAVAFVMAVSVDHAFDSEVLWFAVPYILMRQLGWGLMLRVTWHDRGERSAAMVIAIAAQLGLVSVLLGAFADPETRLWWWLAAIVLDMLSAYLGGKSLGWNIRIAHFVERHALIVIIALGESLIVAAAAVAGDLLTNEMLVSGGIAVLIVCLLWWSYFGWIREFFEERLLKAPTTKQVVLTRDGFSLGHFPLLCGIIALAVGLEQILSHPANPVEGKVVAALGLGVVLFVGSTAGTVWRLSGIILWPRFIILGIGAAFLLLSVSKAPIISLSLIASTLLLIVLIEEYRAPHSSSKS
ncbi:low temperature requirement protein A [bacterium]|nr:low temperature requirement protein A [bacterium]